MKILCLFLFSFIVSISCDGSAHSKIQELLKDNSLVSKTQDLSVAITEILDENRAMQKQINNLNDEITKIYVMMKKEKEERQVDDFCHKSYCDLLDDRITEEKIVRKEENAALNDNVTSVNDDIANVKSDIANFQATPRFLATSYTGEYLPKGTIKFDTLEYGNGFDKDTGIFNAPQSGTYIFFFNAFVWPYSEVAGIKVYLNNYDTLHFWSNAHEDSDYRDRQLSVFWSMTLERNDEVSIYNQAADSLWADTDNRMYFRAFLAN